MILRNLVQVSFLLHLFFESDLISKDRLFVIDYNPLFHLLRLLRDPLLGNSIPLSSYVFVLVISVGLLLGSVLRRRLSHEGTIHMNSPVKVSNVSLGCRFQSISTSGLFRHYCGSGPIG